jgi:hypothetical protein
MLPLDANRKLQNVGRSDLAGTLRGERSLVFLGGGNGRDRRALVGMSSERLAVGHTASRMAPRISRVARQI